MFDDILEIGNRGYIARANWNISAATRARRIQLVIDELMDIRDAIARPSAEFCVKAFSIDQMGALAYIDSILDYLQEG